MYLSLGDIPPFTIRPKSRFHGTKMQSSKICPTLCAIKNPIRIEYNGQSRIEERTNPVRKQWLDLTANQIKCMLRTPPSFARPSTPQTPQTHVQAKSNPSNAWLELLAAKNSSYKDQLCKSLVGPLLSSSSPPNPVVYPSPPPIT